MSYFFYIYDFFYLDWIEEVRLEILSKLTSVKFNTMSNRHHPTGTTRQIKAASVRRSRDGPIARGLFNLLI